MNKADFLEQVKAKLGLGRVDVTLSKDRGRMVGYDYALSISNTSSPVDFDFEFLAWLSDVFDSRKINVGNRWGSEGCGTCGHGARHEVTVFILNSPKLFD